MDPNQKWRLCFALWLMLQINFQIGDCETYVDLSYSIGNGTNLWPTHRRIQRIVESEMENESGQWYARDFVTSIAGISSNSYVMSEHTSTHMDAPYHVYPTTWKLDEIPADRIYGVTTVMMDISRKVFLPGGAVRSNYAMVREDVLEWEYYNGRVPPKSLVLVKTGWGRKWNNTNEFLGIKSDGTLSFPGIGLSASKFVVNERQIYGLGIDVVSLDIGLTTTFPTHAFCGSKNVYLIENVANLDNVPPKGFKTFVFPIRLDQSTGSPVRIFAVLP